MRTAEPNTVSDAECERWRDEAKRLGVEFYGGGALRHISCRECRALRNKVRAAQAAEKAAGITIPPPVEDGPLTKALRGMPAKFTDVFGPPPPPSLPERFARVVSRAERLGVTVRLVAAPTESYEAIRNPRYRLLGHAADLEGQLDIIEAYVAGYGWKGQD